VSKPRPSRSAKSPAVETAGLSHLLASSARSGKQARSREHDPCDERGNAGKQQDIIQDFGHDSLPRTEVPLPRGIGDPRTMAKRWQSPAKNACLRGSMNPQNFSRGVPGRGPKATACRARGPAGRRAGAGVAAPARCRPSVWAGRLGHCRPCMMTGVPCSSITPRDGALKVLLDPRRCVSTIATTNDGEDGLKMFGTGCFMLRNKHPTGTACGLSSFADGKPRRVRLSKSVAVGRVG
jgi:hypothetical protein